MKTTILTFLSLIAVAFAAPVNVTITLSDKEQTSIKAASDKFNADAKVIFDASEAAKKVANPAYVIQTYAPVSVVNYFRARVADLLASYSASVIADAAVAPENQTAHQKFLALPESAKATIRAQIDAAAIANP